MLKLRPSAASTESRFTSNPSSASTRKYAPWSPTRTSLSWLSARMASTTATETSLPLHTGPAMRFFIESISSRQLEQSRRRIARRHTLHADEHLPVLYFERVERDVSVMRVDTAPRACVDLPVMSAAGEHVPRELPFRERHTLMG